MPTLAVLGFPGYAAVSVAVKSNNMFTLNAIKDLKPLPIEIGSGP